MEPPRMEPPRMQAPRMNAPQMQTPPMAAPPTVAPTIQAPRPLDQPAREPGMPNRPATGGRTSEAPPAADRPTGARPYGRPADAPIQVAPQFPSPQPGAPGSPVRGAAPAPQPGAGPARSAPPRPAGPESRPSSSPARVAPPSGDASRGWKLDSRHGSRHFYPSAGHTVSSLPRGHRSLDWRNDRYYFHGGIWYRPWHSGYVVVRPPIGIWLPVLPPYYTTLWVGSTFYYYANDVYYMAAPGGYTVVEAPTSAVIASGAGRGSADEGGPYAEGTWYYCAASDAYYPYVTECAVDWQAIPAVPPELLPHLASTPSYPEGTWYWCDSAQAYYPYLRQCPEGWRPVPAARQNGQ